MKVLVCGGRRYDSWKHLSCCLDLIHYGDGDENEDPDEKIEEIIHGGATGADSLAERWAKENSIPTRVFPAEWETYGRAAGPIRNTKMLEEGKPDLVLAFEGGAGTGHMTDLAEGYGVPVIKL